MTISEYGTLDKPTIGDRLESLEKQIQELQARVYQLEHPNEWMMRTERSDVCSVCKIEHSGTMGYVCNRTDCPMQPIVTSGSSAG